MVSRRDSRRIPSVDAKCRCLLPVNLQRAKSPSAGDAKQASPRLRLSNMVVGMSHAVAFKYDDGGVRHDTDADDGPVFSFGDNQFVQLA